jgi:hypothetical protein
MSMGMSDYVPKRINEINKKSLAHFVDIDALDKRISGLNESVLSKEKADLIKLYKNPPKDRFAT